MQPAKEICPTTTFNKVKNGALLVDVRRKAEVDDIRFDVPAYLHIPLSELENRLDEIPRDREVIFVCRSGSRSLRATYFLMNAGYENVYNMKDGIIKWAAKGFPVKGNKTALYTIGDSCDCSDPDCC